MSTLMVVSGVIDDLDVGREGAKHRFVLEKVRDAWKAGINEAPTKFVPTGKHLKF